jgi:hypothetical protein
MRRTGYDEEKTDQARKEREKRGKRAHLDRGSGEAESLLRRPREGEAGRGGEDGGGGVEAEHGSLDRRVEVE